MNGHSSSRVMMALGVILCAASMAILSGDVPVAGGGVRIEAVSGGDVRRVAGEVFRGRLAASVLGNLRGWRPRDRDLQI